MMCCSSQYIIQFWDDILRFIATIKLKETTASDIFRRLKPPKLTD
jgi:hypothetical protein